MDLDLRQLLRYLLHSLLNSKEQTWVRGWAVTFEPREHERLYRTAKFSCKIFAKSIGFCGEKQASQLTTKHLQNLNLNFCYTTKSTKILLLENLDWYWLTSPGTSCRVPLHIIPVPWPRQTPLSPGLDVVHHTLKLLEFFAKILDFRFHSHLLGWWKWRVAAAAEWGVVGAGLVAMATAVTTGNRYCWFGVLFLKLWLHKCQGVLQPSQLSPQLSILTLAKHQP